MNAKRFLQISVTMIVILATVLPVQAAGLGKPLNDTAEFLWAGKISGAGDDHGYSLAVDVNGNTYITGSFEGISDFDPGAGVFQLISAGSEDVFVTKFDRAGSLLWAKRIGGESEEEGYGIAVDQNSFVYVTGYFKKTADFDPGTGTFNLTSTGLADAFIVKLNDNGNFVWARNLGGTGCDGGESIGLDSHGNVFTAGHFEATADFDPGMGTANLNSAGDFDIFVSKLDGAGNFVWAGRMGGAGGDYGYSIGLDPGGSVYITGDFSGTADFDPGAGTFNLASAGNHDIFVSKLNNSGGFVWARRMGGTSSEEGNSIYVDAESNVYTTGSFLGPGDYDPGAGVYSLSTAGNWDVFVSKLDGNGSFIWARSMGGVEADSSYDIAADSQGNIYTTGFFFGEADFNPGSGRFPLASAGNDDVFLSKLTSSGNFAWAGRMGGGSDDIGTNLVIAADDKIYMTGTFRTTTTFGFGETITTLTSAGDDDTFVASFRVPSVTTLDKDTIGVFRPDNGIIYLKNSNTSGFADLALNYGLAGDYPVVGDWDGNGTDTIGVYRGNTFLLRNSNTVGFADLSVVFGQAGDQPVAGDWDGNGTDTIGVYRPMTGQFQLRNSNTTGPAEISFYLGNAKDVGIAGDWNGDGVDTTGVFRPSNGVIYLKNSNVSGYADVGLNYGLPGDQPVVGDWDNDGITTIGVYRGARFYLRNSNTNGYADTIVDLGLPGDMPIAGNWDGKP